MPSPSQSGWYVAPTGTKACHQRMSTYSSTTAVATCTTSSSVDTSARLRWTDWVRNRGTREPASPRVARTPSTVVSDEQHQQDDAGPAVGVQRNGPCSIRFSCVGRGGGGGRRPGALRVTEPSRPTSRALTPWSSSQGTAAAAQHQAAVVAVLAATQVGPVAVTVRQCSSVGRPVRGSTRWCPRRRRGCASAGPACWRWPARRPRSPPPRRRRWSSGALGDPRPSRPAPSRRRAVDARVAAEADQRRARRGLRRRRPRPGRRPDALAVAPRSRAHPGGDPRRRPVRVLGGSRATGRWWARRPPVKHGRRCCIDPRSASYRFRTHGCGRGRGSTQSRRIVTAASTATWTALTSSGFDPSGRCPSSPPGAGVLPG